MLGIDVSKATLASTLLDPRSHTPQWTRTVPNTPTGIAQLLRATPAGTPLVIEPTGPWSLDLARQARAAGHPVLLAQPRRAKAFLAAIQPRAKTDRLDSLGLARYALAVPLPPYPIPDAAMEQLDQLLAARKGLSRSLASLGQQRQQLPAAAAALEAAMTALREQQRALDRQIAAATAELDARDWPVAAELRRVPGIGAVTAAAIASRLATRSFAHPDQFVAYVGLDVRVRDSGQRRGKRALSRQGDAELRRLLFLCARANLRSVDPANPFRQQYQRELAKGLAPTAALCAVARKLARTCWSIAHHRTPYDPARVTRQPHPPRHTHSPEDLDAQP